MKEKICTIGEKMIIYIPREVDHCFADEIRDMVDRKLQLENIQYLEFDFKNTEFMDSSGIGIIIGRYKKIALFGGKVFVVHADKQIKRILSVSGMGKLVEIME